MVLESFVTVTFLTFQSLCLAFGKIFKSFVAVTFLVFQSLCLAMGKLLVGFLCIVYHETNLLASFSSSCCYF